MDPDTINCMILRIQVDKKILAMPSHVSARNEIIKKEAKKVP